MNRFWDDVIKPIFLKENIKSIIEIGCADGINTHNILAYCSEQNAHLLAIDPVPQFDVDTLEMQNPHFAIKKDLSLNALPLITHYDAILIDGDHNWFTVYHELKTIEKNSLKNHEFPIIFFHDTDWPYGRRDMYYFPISIPSQYRKPYAQKGMLQGFNGLIDSNEVPGIGNPQLNNALYEGGEQNGVLTAIEDFIKESSIPLNFINITINHGLGILFPKNKNLAIFIENLAKNYYAKHQ